MKHRAAMLLAVVAAGLGCAPRVTTGPKLAEPAPKEPHADYLIVAPREFFAALEPLRAHRRANGHEVAMLPLDLVTSDGRPDAHRLQATVRAHWQRGHGALRFLFLVGDVGGDATVPQIPTFYLPKLAYEPPDRLAFSAAERAFRSGLAQGDAGRYPSDHPYGVMDPAKRANLAVGRLPARTARQVAGFVQKLLAYEQRSVKRDWPRRLVVHAGPAKMGAFIDSVLRRTAVELLDQRVPYDFDLRVTFADPLSPYNVRPDRIGEQLSEEAERGALMLAYVGHSSPASFDWIEYRGQLYSLGSRHEFEHMRIREGAPLFVSLSCDAGAFDMSGDERSIAEEAVLNPGGPIAAFASSRVSHPYPNMLYGEALIEELLLRRPATLGEGINRAKGRMLADSSLIGELLAGIDTDALRAEHESLYNLLGDPATVLRYPERATIELASSTVAPASAIDLALRAPNVLRGRATVSVETRRRQIQGPLVSAAQLEELPLEQAFAAMSDNHRRASDKSVAAFEAVVERSRAALSITSPREPGDYVLKVLVEPEGDGSILVGHALFRVAD